MNARPIFCPTKEPPKLSESAAKVMGVISDGTYDAPISLASVAAQVGLSKRTVEGCVEDLILTHRVKIGARRGDVSGYFIPRTYSEMLAAARPHQRQLASMARRVAILRGNADLLILAGQLELELKEQERA